MTNKNLNITSQNEAFKSILAKLSDIVKSDMKWDNIISLSGAAGTGKSYLTTKLVKELTEFFHITITAPTHKALQVLKQNLIYDEIHNVETKTLQAFLNIRLVTDYNNGVQRFEPIKVKREKDNSQTDILIVDESSMVSGDLYEYIISAIEEYRVKAVLLVGDEYQLLPVDGLDSQTLDIRMKYKLETIVRQARDSYIINIATKARNIIKSKKYISLQEFLQDETFANKIEFFNTEKEFHDDFCTPSDTWSKNDKVIASFTNKSIDHHNKIIRSRYWQQQGQTDIPTLLKGDKVIFQQANIIDEKVVHQNSDIVELSSASKHYIKSIDIEFWDCKDLSNRPLKVIDPKSTIKFKKGLDEIAKKAKMEKDYKTRSELWRLFYDIKGTFVDVKYTYASTIHKLQGSTYETVYLDLREIENMKDKDLMFRLLYVAITRASTNVKILLPNDINISLSNYQEGIIDSLDDKFKNLGLDF